MITDGCFMQNNEYVRRTQEEKDNDWSHTAWS